VLLIGSPFCVVCFSRGNESVDVSASWSDKHSYISTCLGLSNDEIAPFSCLTYERVPENDLVHLFNTDMMAGDMFFTIRLKNQFNDFHKSSIFLPLIIVSRVFAGKEPTGFRGAFIRGRVQRAI
jgi:hypothetical protein